MSAAQVLEIALRLGNSMEALAALGATLRIRAAKLTPDPELERRLRAVTDALGVPSLDALSAQELEALLAMIVAPFKQAEAMLDHPDRPPGWDTQDASVLESQGRGSVIFASVLQQAAPQLPGLVERLASPGAAFLDVGTGVGWLAIGMARAFPVLRVVGVDVWAPSLALARGNLTGSGVADRIELRLQDARELPDVAAFDLAWFPGPFVPRQMVPAILERLRRALRPGGVLVFGRFPAPPDPLAASVAELRIVRAGGHPWTSAGVEDLLRAHGFAGVRTLERTWQAPMVFTVGTSGQ